MSKAYLAIILVSTIATVGGQSSAFAAGSSCSAVFAFQATERAREAVAGANNGLKLARSFEGLATRVIEAKRKYSVQASLFTDLTPSERRTMSRSFKTSIQATKSALVQIKQLPEMLSRESKLREFAEQVDSRLAKSEELVEEFRLNALYKHAIEISLDVQTLLDLTQQALISKEASMELYYLKRGVPGADLSFVIDSTKRAIDKGAVPIPTGSDLSIRDFLDITGSAIAPLGMVLKPVRGDQGSTYDITTFYVHDLAHAGSAPIHFDTRENVYWHELLVKVRLEESRMSGIMEGLLFYLAHERSASGKSILNISAAREKFEQPAYSWGLSVYDYLSKEHFYFEDPKSQPVPSQREYETAKMKLLTLMQKASDSVGH